MNKRNQNLMKAIRAVHSIAMHDDIEKRRISQDNLGIFFSANKNKDVNYEEVEIEGISAEWIRVNRRHMRKHVLLYCHGGGYFTGSIKYARILTTKLAAATSMDVLCFDYALAPENPYPAALQDAVKIWDYLMYLGYGSRDVVIAGDSAGGNLGLALMLMLKKQSRLLPKGAVLLSPWTDLTLSSRSQLEKDEVDPVLSAEYLHSAVQAYAAEKDLQDPFISPLYGDFTGFPPVYIQVGENEKLLDDSVLLWKTLKKANVFVRMDVFGGMWHVFQMSPFKKAYDAMDQIAEFIFEIYR